jgi:hypothetical protein
MVNYVVELQNGTGWSLEYMWNVLTFELDFRRLWFIIEMELHSIMALITN